MTMIILVLYYFFDEVGSREKGANREDELLLHDTENTHVVPQMG
jgi:hypothetical protein